MSGFNGKWKLVDSENFEEYMKALNVDVMTRKLGNTLKPSQEINITGDEFSIKTVSTFKNTEIKGKFGEEFDEKTMDGRMVKSTITKESDSKLVHVQKGDPEGTITREVDGDNYTMILEVKDIKCTRKYHRQ